jgi:hypothetical protein
MPMPITSPWLDPGGASDMPQWPQFRYINASGSYVAALPTGKRDPLTNKVVYDLRSILLGTFVAPDWGQTYHGLHRFGPPYDASLMVPMHIAPLLVPPGEGYKFAVRIPVLVQGIDRILYWTCTGSIEPREMRSLYTAFEYCPEAADGLLRVYALRTSRQFTATVKDPATGTMMNKSFTASVWEPAHWMQRTTELFGERIVPAPSLQVGAMPAAPLLPPQGAPPASGTPLPAVGNDNAAGDAAPAAPEAKPDPFRTLQASGTSRSSQEPPPF